MVKINSDKGKQNAKKIMVFLDGISQMQDDMLNKARELSDLLGGSLIALLAIRPGEDEDINKLKTLGVDFVIETELYKEVIYKDELYIKILKDWVVKIRPQILLFASTSLNNSIAPRLAVHFKTGITADCVDLSIDRESKKLLQIRPAYEGDMLATIICPKSFPQIATYIGKCNYTMKEPLRFKFKRIRVKADYISSDLVEVIKYSVLPSKEKNVSIVIGIGKGMGNEYNVSLAYKLALILNGCVMGTREAVKAGWILSDQQIGQSGRKIRSSIYLAFGISGTLQHLCGLINPKYVIAVNTDPEAAIFYGANKRIIADAGAVLECLVEKLKV